MTQVAAPCEECDCGGGPGPQPCNSGCPACTRGTKPKVVRLTISGVTERAGAAGQTYIPGPMAEDCSTELGDVVTDVFACLGLNRSFDMGCNDYAGSDSCSFLICGKLSPGACTVGPTALHSINTYFEFGTSPFARNFQVRIKRHGECGSPPSGETGNEAVFYLYQNDYETDCSGVKNLTQYLTESTSNPCDFSGATVTLEVIEFAFTLPETLYLSIDGTCLDDDVASEIELTLDTDGVYKGTINCGEQTLTVWFSCTLLDASPCLDPNDPTAQTTWRLQIFDGDDPDWAEECFFDTSAASDAQDPFLWERTASPSAAYGCCLCTTETLTFTVSE